jgi:hypothetical protein
MRGDERRDLALPVGGCEACGLASFRPGCERRRLRFQQLVLSRASLRGGQLRLAVRIRTFQRNQTRARLTRRSVCRTLVGVDLIDARGESLLIFDQPSQLRRRVRRHVARVVKALNDRPAHRAKGYAARRGTRARRGCTPGWARVRCFWQVQAPMSVVAGTFCGSPIWEAL